MSCEVELSTCELFTNECIIVKMSTEVDDVVRKPARAAEMSTTSERNFDEPECQKISRQSETSKICFGNKITTDTLFQGKSGSL